MRTVGIQELSKTRADNNFRSLALKNYGIFRIISLPMLLPHQSQCNGLDCSRLTESSAIASREILVGAILRLFGAGRSFPRWLSLVGR